LLMAFRAGSIIYIELSYEPATLENFRMVVLSAVPNSKS
jgi:hypothetical protein